MHRTKFKNLFCLMKSSIKKLINNTFMKFLALLTKVQYQFLLIFNYNLVTYWNWFMDMSFWKWIYLTLICIGLIKRKNIEKWQNFTIFVCLQYTINGQFQFEGSNYRQKERKRGKHLLLHGDIFNQWDSIDSSRAYGGVHESFYQTSKGRVISFE